MIKETIIKEKKMSKQVCVICNKEFEGWGNNAEPVKEGVCCDECNNSVVISARIFGIYNNEKENK